MKVKVFFGVVGILLCMAGAGALLFSACPNDSNDSNDSVNSGGYNPNYAESEAFFPVVDGLSSASILRVKNDTMAYVGERTGTNYWLNKVDLNDPKKKISRNIGGNVAVITASTDHSKIGLIQAVEHGYEAFAGAYTKIYDAGSLELLKTFPLAPPAAAGRIVEPLHHRDPSLSLTDKYAVVLTEDDGYFASGGAQQYLSVYDIAGNKEASHTNAFSGAAGSARGNANPVLGVGTLMGAVVHGDYIIVGGNSTTSATAVLKINATDSALTVSKVTTGYTADTAANHWFKDNGTYVLESKSNGKVQVWKWNGANAPTVVGQVDVYGTTGSIQALCFDPDTPNIAYFYQKAAATGSEADLGSVYRVDLSTSTLTKTKVFTFAKWVFSISGRNQPATWYEASIPSGIWTIEKQKAGTDDYYVLAGSYSYGTPATTVGAVFTFKNPVIGDSFGGTYTDSTTGTADATGKVTATTFTAPWGTAVRTLKTFKSASGDVYFAAKNYTASGAASNYKLVLEQIND